VLIIPHLKILTVLRNSHENFGFRLRKGAFRVLVGEPEGKIPLERLRRRWEDNIKMDVSEVGFRLGMYRSGLTTGTGGRLF
jgi:hypothetical protein